MKTYVMILATVMLLPALAYAAEKAVALETEIDKVSYIMGTQAGQRFKAQGIEINLELLVRGIEDAMAGREPVLSQEEMRQIMTEFGKRMRAKQLEQRKKEAAENLVKSKAFLEENKTKPGVQVLPSGLQYKVMKDGTGRTPTATDRVKVNYRGTLIDGTEFDSTEKQGEPYELAVAGRIIPGWKEALQLMKEGAKWQLFIPHDLAYGERRAGIIPPNAALIFEIELLEILSTEAASGTSAVPQ